METFPRYWPFVWGIPPPPPPVIVMICLPISCYRDNLILKKVSNIMFFCNRYVGFSAYNPICIEARMSIVWPYTWSGIVALAHGPRCMINGGELFWVAQWPSPIYVWLWCVKQLFVWPDAFRETIIAPHIWPWLLELEINQSLATSRNMTLLFSLTHKASLLKQLVRGI